MPKRIFYLITDLNIGGTEKQLADLLRDLDQTKYTPFVCGLKGWGKTADDLKNSGFKVAACGMPTQIFFHPIAFLKSLAALWRMLANFRPDIIHTFLFRANFLGRLFAVFFKQASVISTVGVWDGRTIPLFLEKITASRARAVTFNSKWVADQFKAAAALKETQVRVIANGIDLAPFETAQKNREAARQKLGLKSSDKLLLGVGRLDEQKGFFYLLQAFEMCLKKFSDIHLLIAGDGPLKNKIETRLNQSGLDARVKLLGFRQDIPELLAASDIFILSSLWEGSPNAVMEAMAAQTPIIATKVGGVPELIKDQESGLLVPPGNSQTLSQAIERVLEDDTFGRALAGQAFEKIKDSSPLKRAKEFQKIYDEVL